MLEEGLRGAGAHLRNAHGERYMARYDPERLERSTRDVVSRSGYQEITAGRGTPAGGVWIDVSHLGAANVRRQFPGMVERCKAVGRRPGDRAGGGLADGPLPHGRDRHRRATAARIWRGCSPPGRTPPGCTASNRLGGNGVAESIVFGARAGEAIAAYVAGRDLPAVDAAFAAAAAQAALAPLHRAGGEDAFALRERLGVLTWEQVGLVRDAAGLRAARTELDDLYARAGGVAVNPERRLNGEWQQALDVRNLIEVARLIARAALLREESRGSHYRADFPAPDDARWLANICFRGPGWGSSGATATATATARPCRWSCGRRD